MSNINRESFSNMLYRLSSLIRRDDLADEDKEYLSKLDKIVDDYRDTIIFKRVFDNCSEVGDLKNRIQLLIKSNDYDDSDAHYEDNGIVVGDYVVDEANELNSELSAFEENNCPYDDKSRLELLSIFSNGLDSDTYFREKLFNDGHFNYELANRICGILVNDKVMRDLLLINTTCIELIKADIIKNHLKDVLGYEEKLYDNIDLLSEYHNLREDLNTPPMASSNGLFDVVFFERQLFKKRKSLGILRDKKRKTQSQLNEITELEREIKNLSLLIKSFKPSPSEKISKIARLKEIDNSFSEEGIQSIVSKAYQDRNNEGDLDSLETSNYRLADVSNKEELDTFFEVVRKDLSIYEALYKKNRINLEYQFKHISLEAKELLQKDFCTCCSIVDLAKTRNIYGIKKAYCLLGSGILSNLNSMGYSDFTDSSSDEKTDHYLDMKIDYYREAIDTICYDMERRLNCIDYPNNDEHFILMK